MITKISLESFRNFTNFSAELGHTTVALGQNAVGKSTILEAIALFGGYRFTRSLSELIQWGKPFARTDLVIRDRAYSSMRVVVRLRNLSIVGDDQLISVNEGAACLPIVYFSPRTVTLLEDSPSLRRRFFDHVLSTISPEYRHALRVYQHTLRQRNASLKQSRASQHMVWEAALAEHGSYVQIMRNWLARTLSQQLEFNGELVYHMSPQSGQPLLPQSGDWVDNIKTHRQKLQEFLITKWSVLREREMHVGFTLMGAQRDDWWVTTVEEERQINLGTFGSRGQQRMAIVALQFAVLRLLEDLLEYRPIWLLDDVFSELDTFHQEKVIERLSQYQTVITSAHEEYPGIHAVRELSDVHTIRLGDH